MQRASCPTLTSAIRAHEARRPIRAARRSVYSFGSRSRGECTQMATHHIVQAQGRAGIARVQQSLLIVCLYGLNLVRGKRSQSK